MTHIEPTVDAPYEDEVAPRLLLAHCLLGQQTHRPHPLARRVMRANPRRARPGYAPSAARGADRA
ncbi:hypothetical protein [Streptomyces sp. NPDC058683]|uniref:hypothetical protein n=1 Tax=Streptomyces sp. NPDC058683 TaxID=3346597 RepID=UPI00364AEB09